jgi:hypothetical protein
MTEYFSTVLLADFFNSIAPQETFATGLKTGRMGWEKCPVDMPTATDAPRCTTRAANI